MRKRESERDIEECASLVLVVGVKTEQRLLLLPWQVNIFSESVCMGEREREGKIYKDTERERQTGR